MATEAPAAKAIDAKVFAIQHMNKNHQDALALYLRVYNRVPTRQAKHAQLEDISLSDLVLTAKGTRYTVPIDPPMKSLMEFRTRAVAMQKHCLHELGLSDIVVKEYRAPHGFTAVVFIACAFTFIGFSRRENFLPGSIIHDSLGLGTVPSFTRFCYDIQPLLFWPMLAVHFLEATVLAVKKLRRHQVPFLSGLWVVWFASAVIEGFGSFVRFNRIVREEKEKVKGE